MKKLLVLLFLMSVPYIYATNKPDRFDDNDEVALVANGVEPKKSILRMQNKVIAGLEVSLNPSTTLTNEFIMRTLTNFRIGYRLNKHVLTGSLGVEFTKEMFLPLTIDYKYYFNKDRIWSPFVYGQIGYSWQLKQNINSRYNTSKYAQYDSGVLTSVGLGYSFASTVNEYYFSIGYSYRKYVKAMPGENKGDEMIRTDMSMNGISINIGINF